MTSWKSALWRRWTLACGTGEFLGIGIAGVSMFLYIQLVGEPDTQPAQFGQLLTALLAGAVEGFILATFQLRVFRECLPQLPRMVWIRYTMAVAMLGWLLGMIYPTFFASGPVQAGSVPEPPLLLILGGAAAMGLTLGALFGWFQWLAFRAYVPHTRIWILANALGWMVGMVLIFLFATMPDEQTPAVWILLSGFAGGLLGGLSVGAITGLFLLHILDQHHIQLDS